MTGRTHRLRWALLAALVGGWSAAAAEPGQVTPLANGWRFFQGDPPGAETTDFDDRAWSAVSVPHDWAIAGPVSVEARAGGAGGFFPTGVSWYRHALPLMPKPGRRVFVELDGVMERSGVWINGHHLGHRPYGYVGLRYDLTPFLRADGRNVLAVRADTSMAPSSRWYAGSGITRKVRLVETGDLNIDQGGVAITTPTISADEATARIQVDVANAAERGGEAQVSIRILGPDGREVAQGSAAPIILAPAATGAATVELKLPKPRLWDLAAPALYTAVIQVGDTRGVSDERRVRFGVRTAEFRADTGFWLNGRNFKLKGVAVHEDGGPVGAAVPAGVWRQRLTALKALGVNAIRTAHNPPSPALLDLADAMGFVVMDELFDQWNVAKTPNDYHLFFSDWHKKDARDIIRRDRNHPSIVIWSLGNEIHDTAYPVQAKAALASLIAAARAADPSRPLTMGLFRPNVTGDYQNGLADMLDVVGQNYREKELIAAHEDKPTRRILGTENSKTRGSWVAVRDYPAYAGLFLWTGVDYLGESDRSGWPNIGNPAGLLDRTGAAKIVGLERASWWADKPVIHVVRNAAPAAPPPSSDGAGPAPALPTMIAVATPAPPQRLFDDWTPADLSPHDETIEVYSNCASVEVSLNGRALGAKPLPADASPRQWSVRFAPGEVVATCRGGPADGLADRLRTAGPAKRIVLESDTPQVGADFDDIAFVRARVVDAKGVTVPGATQPLTFRVEGGRVVATDNGAPAEHVPFESPTRAPLNGLATGLVRGAGRGPVTVEVTGPGLQGGKLILAAGVSGSDDGLHIRR